MRRLSALAIGCAAAVAMAAPVGPMPLQPQAAHARSGCVTVDRVSVRIDGLVRAGGRESAFEHRVVVNVRDAKGRVIARSAVTGRNRRWNASFFVHSPRDQKGTLEALSRSPKAGSVTCLARRSVRLPFTSPPAQKLVYRALADVDGDGRSDLVSLHRTSRTTGAIDVTLASGRHLSVSTDSEALGRPALLWVGMSTAAPVMSCSSRSSTSRRATRSGSTRTRTVRCASRVRSHPPRTPGCSPGSPALRAFSRL